jgi:hypothetical protein
MKICRQKSTSANQLEMTQESKGDTWKYKTKPLPAEPVGVLHHISVFK